MTKKDYELAATLAQVANDITRDAIVTAFIALFTADGNSRFDVARFRAACVPGANVKARNK